MRIRGHRSYSKRSFVVAPLASLLLVTGTSTGSVGAQETLPTVPAAESCTIAPRESPVWDGIEIAEPTAPVWVDQPFSPPSGDPVDDATLTAVTATISQSIACQNAGDIGRMLALFSDDGVRGFFSGPRGYDPDEVDSAIGAGATPAPADRVIELVAITDVITLEDGTVAATVTTRASGLDYIDVVYLVAAPAESEVDWLIEDSIAVDSQTQPDGEATEIP